MYVLSIRKKLLSMQQTKKKKFFSLGGQETDGRTPGTQTGHLNLNRKEKKKTIGPGWRWRLVQRIHQHIIAVVAQQQVVVARRLDARRRPFVRRLSGYAVNRACVTNRDLSSRLISISCVCMCASATWIFPFSAQFSSSVCCPSLTNNHKQPLSSAV